MDNKKWNNSKGISLELLMAPQTFVGDIPAGA